MDLIGTGAGGSRSWHSLLWHQWVAALRAVVTATRTVRQDADGTVTVCLRQYADPAALLVNDTVPACVSRPKPTQCFAPEGA